MKKDNEDFKERHSELKQIHKEWRDISVEQLSNVNNILIGLSSGLLAYFITKKDNSTVVINIKNSIDSNLVLYWCGIISLGISICYGIAVLISRLYDFRISRQTALIRQKYYEEKQDELPRDDIGNFNACHRIEVFFSILFIKLPRITTEKIKSQDITSEFNKLRRFSKVLGSCTWLWTKVQLLFFILSGVLILIYHMG